jgi:hypothetical protein
MEHGENMGALDTKLTALANAIRTKTGVTGALSLDAMANAITDYKNSTTATDVSFIQRTVERLVIPSGITSLKQNTFTKCYYLTSIRIPSSVVSIESYVFSDCISLTDIYCGFAQGAVSGAPWGAPNATIHYNS